MSPVSVCLSGCNILPRQRIEACDIKARPVMTVDVERLVTPPTVVVDWQQNSHQNRHHRQENEDHSSNEADEEVAIEATLRLELVIFDAEDAAQPSDWRYRNSLDSQTFLHKIRLGLTAQHVSGIISMMSNDLRALSLSDA